MKGPRRGTLGATQYRKKNWQIAKYRYRIYDQSRLLIVVSISRVLSQA